MERGYWVYLLASGRNGTLYIGVTGDLRRRLKEHRSGAVPGFTRRYGVTRFVHGEAYADVQEARYRERQLKGWRRRWKLELIERANPQWRDLSAEVPY